METKFSPCSENIVQKTFRNQTRHVLYIHHYLVNRLRWPLRLFVRNFIQKSSKTEPNLFTKELPRLFSKLLSFVSSEHRYRPKTFKTRPHQVNTQGIVSIVLNLLRLIALRTSSENLQTRPYLINTQATTSIFLNLFSLNFVRFLFKLKFY